MLFSLALEAVERKLARLGLSECAPWPALQDGNPLWLAHVQATLSDLGWRLGHGL